MVTGVAEGDGQEIWEEGDQEPDTEESKQAMLV